MPIFRLPPIEEWHWEKVGGTDWVSTGGLMVSPANFAVFYDNGHIFRTESAAKCRKRIKLVEDN